MQERFIGFLPSFASVAGLWLLGFLWGYLVRKKYTEQIKSINWLENNRWKACFIGSPYVLIYAPAREELLFRALIILFFNDITRDAWVGIIISAIVFSACHWKGNKLTWAELLKARKEGKIKTENVEEAFNELSKAKGEEQKIRRAIHVGVTFFLGIFIGYCGIKYQSLWLSVGIHALFNLLLPLVVLIAFAVFLLLVGIIGFLVFLVLLVLQLVSEIRDSFRSIPKRAR